MNEERREKITLFFCLVADFFLFFSPFFFGLSVAFCQKLFFPLSQKKTLSQFFFITIITTHMRLRVLLSSSLFFDSFNITLVVSVRE